MPKSTRSAKSGKLRKPRPDFPLFPHASGRWAKKVRGRLVYFGKVVDDPHGERALAKWLDDRDDLLAGRTPRGQREGLTVGELCNRFLTERLALVKSEELTPRTFAEYVRTTDQIVAAFGKRRLVDDLAADDFAQFRAALAKSRGPVALGNEIQRARTVFKFAFDNGLVDRPVRYGTSFDKPSAKAVRKAKAERGSQMFSAAELRRLLDALADKPDPVLRAMVLLALNCAYGAADVASLPQSALDLDDGWADFPRVKTAVPRRAKLWPETVEALRSAIAVRPTPKDAADAGLVFITPRGKRWLQRADASDLDETSRWRKWGARQDLISRAFRAALDKLGINCDRGFYSCRRTFQTAAEECCGDFPAVAHIMGHAPRLTDMSATYRQRISDDRLRAVAEVVRAWLFTRRDG